MSRKAKSLTKHLSKPIVLTGMMGTGKTRIGSILAKKLGLDFIDSDHRIVDVSGYTIPEIFEKYGEEEFRRVEARVIENLLAPSNTSAEPAVIALGGGAIMNAETLRLVKERSHSIWIQADPALILERVSKNSNRPLLACADPKDTLQKLMDERQHYYAKADCHVVNSDDDSASTIAQILEFLEAQI